VSPLVAAYRREFVSHAHAAKDVAALLRPFVQGLTEDQEARVRALLSLAYDKGHSAGLNEEPPGSGRFDDD